MIQDSIELQGICDKAVTEDQIIQCFQRSLEFQQKWGSMMSL